MTYAALLVPVEADPDPDHRIALAVDLANQFDATLIGVAAEAWKSPAVASAFDVAGYAAVALIDAEDEVIAVDLARAEAKFRRAAADVRQGTEWRSASKWPIMEVAAEARAADLVVTSRSVRPGASAYNVAAPGGLVLAAGRPVIIAPQGADKLAVGSIVVAWKDSRESRRAVSDALPVLKRAKSVILAEVCAYEEAAAAKTRLDDLARSLLRHGIRSSTMASVQEKDVEPCQQLLDLADEHEADLIVAGAYGHSRFQEWVFGGFTRALLAQTSRAIMLSH
jgi:nucleotide-binding universal stress UspA family protein